MPHRQPLERRPSTTSDGHNITSDQPLMSHRQPDERKVRTRPRRRWSSGQASDSPDNDFYSDSDSGDFMIYGRSEW